MRRIDRCTPLANQHRMFSAAGWWILPATLCAALFLFGIQPLTAQTAHSPESSAAAEGTPHAITPDAQRKMAPDFTLTDAKRQPVTLSAYKGKIVLLDFWATWCGGCKVEIPWYVEFDKMYRNQGLVVIGVSMDDGGMKVVKPFLARKGIDYTVVIGNDELANRYSLASMPMTLLIDRNGRIAVSHTGIVNKDDFESHIKELLK